jgi:arabinogalactan oligomer/maltooligosaccharide transport system substrate-binding protein
MRSVKAICISLCAVAALVLSACGGGGGNSSSGPTQITLWYTQGQSATAAINTIVTNFNTMHSNIHVTAQPVDFSVAHDQFANAARAGNAPDIMRVDASWIAEFAKNLYLTDLTNQVTDTSDFNPAAIANDTYQGKLYAEPETVELPVLYYNMALLQGAGISQPPATMDDLLTDAQKLSQGNVGQYGFATQGSTFYVTPFLYADGGDLVSSDGKTALVNNAQSVSGFTRLLTMIKANAVLPYTSGTAITDAENAFKSGKVALLFDESFELSNLQSGSAFQGANAANLGIAPIPMGTAGDVPRALAGGASYAIYHGSPNPAAAMTFLKYLNSAQNQVAVTQTDGTLPARLSAYTPTLLQTASIQALYNLLGTAHARPVLTTAGSLYSTFDSDIQPALTGSANAQDTLNKVASDWAPLLGNG